MTSQFPTAKNPLTALQELITKAFNFSQVLDFGRYTVRVDPVNGRGWFKSEIKTGTFAGILEFDGKYYRCNEELPPQVAATLERAGYLSAALYLEECQGD